MSNDDVTYYHIRVEAERKQAREAKHPHAERAHSEMARAYLERINRAGAQCLTNHV